MSRLSSLLPHSILALGVLSSAANAQITIGGNVSDSLIAPLLPNTTYILNPGVVVPFGHLWTIPEGVTMKAAAGAIFVQGTLLVQGTPGNRVVFTSSRDDAHGGDTNSDGTMTMGEPGQWNGISFDPAAPGSTIEFADVWYGKGNGASVGAITTNGSPITLRNVIVEAAEGKGIDFSAGFINLPIVENCSVNNCTGIPVVNVHWDALPGISNLNASGNGGGDHVQLGAAPTADVTIQPDNLINATASSAGGAIDIPMGVTVTVNPGCHFKFRPATSTSVRVFGNLQCLGTPDNPVVFTSMHDDSFAGDTGNDGLANTAAPGQWRGIWLPNASEASRLENTVVRFAGISGTPGIDLAGSHAILDSVSVRDCAFEGMNFNANGSRPLLTDCEVLDCGGIAYERAHWHQLPGFSGLTAAGNTTGDYVRVFGSITDDITVGPQNSPNGGPIVAGGNPGIQSTGRLDVLPGTIIKFDVGSIIWQVLGELDLVGTRAEPIVLTSIRDDKYGGDTQKDGTSTLPGNSDWRGIQELAGSAGCEFEHLLIRYGSPLNSYALSTVASDTIVRDVRAEHGAGGGFRLQAITTDVESCVAYDFGQRGFQLVSGSADLLHLTSAMSGSYGIALSAGWTGELRNSIAWDSGTANFQFPPAGRVLYTNGDPILAGVDGNIHLDPMFVDPAHGDLSLAPGSPCIDAGDPSDPLETDGSIVDMGAIMFDQCVPFTYCVSQMNSAGCTPELSFSGFASSTSGTPFIISANDVINNSPGLLFYGLGGQVTLPFFGGTLCVGSSDFYNRLPVMNSGGNAGAPDCSGSYSYDFNGHIASGSDIRLLPGVTVNAQIWSRDPSATLGTNMTNAIQFRICP